MGYQINYISMYLFFFFDNLNIRHTTRNLDFLK